jgi:hypothetical protein
MGFNFIQGLILNGNDSYYLFFTTVSSTNSTNLAAYGLRELTSSEQLIYCKNNLNTSTPPVLKTTARVNLNSDYAYRLWTSGCYYINRTTAAWMSSGVHVQPDTNTTHTHCLSSHLTDFAGADIADTLIVLPDPIDFNYVFSHASFNQNLTIYLTVIISGSLYLILAVVCFWLDVQNKEKTRIHLLCENNPNDLYFYEMIVVTGGRRDAGTRSTVQFNIHGHLSDVVERKLESESKNGKILQRGSFNTFVFSTHRPLGVPYFIRIWHDNRGPGRHASWFLKYIILHDLQSREKFTFSCENWLAVDKEDGQINRLLPIVIPEKKRENKTVKHSIAEKVKGGIGGEHKWFSILGRPSISNFTCLDRLTCSFVVLYIAMLMV